MMTDKQEILAFLESRNQSSNRASIGSSVIALIWAAFGMFQMIRALSDPQLSTVWVNDGLLAMVVAGAFGGLAYQELALGKVCNAVYTLLEHESTDNKEEEG